MVRSNAPRDTGKVQFAESVSFDDYSEYSETNDNKEGFSFFGFTLFEADETLVYNDDDDEEESVIDDRSNKQKVPKIEQSCGSSINSNDLPKRSFWKPSIKTRSSDISDGQSDAGDEVKDKGIIKKIKGNLSRTIGSMKAADLNLVERIRSNSKRNTADDSDSVQIYDKYECRDDSERSYGINHRESFDSAYGDDGKRVLVKKCFPSWSMNKNRSMGSNNIPLFTIDESDSVSIAQSCSSKKSDKYAVKPMSSSYHHHHHRSSNNYGTTTTPRPSRQYEQHQQRYQSRTQPSHRRPRTPTYKKPSNYDDNMWDDESISSGWFSLESLDAR